MSARLPNTVVLAGFGSFFVMGVVQAMYGPALLLIRPQFGLSAGDANWLFSAFFAGVMLMVICAALLERRVSRQSVLVCSTICVGLGTLGVGLASVWALMLFSAFLTGFGYGGHVLNFNTLFASGFGQRSTAMTNLLNAVWSFGAISGPLLIGWWQNHQWPFLLCGTLSLLSLPLVWQTHRLETSQGTAAGASSANAQLWGFALIACLYVGSEVGVGSSEPRFLAEVGRFASNDAAYWSSLFWVGQALGRVVVAPISLRFTADQIVPACLLGCVLGLALAHQLALAAFGFALCGFFLGPVFPSLLSWLTLRRPSLAQTSVVVASANLGGVLFPPLIANLTTNPRWIPSVVLLIAFVNLLSAIMLRRAVPTLEPSWRSDA